MTCPYLEYRTEGDGFSFDHERPFCGANGTFVSPMRADVCNDRYEFDHTSDCPVYREHVESAESFEQEESIAPERTPESEGTLD